MTVPRRYQTRLRQLIQNGSFDAIAREFDNLAAFLNGEGGGTAEAALDDPTAATSGQGPIRWTIGPWLFNLDGNVKGGAVIRPPVIASDQSFYAPDGIDDCIILELESSAEVTISRMKVKTRQSRLILVVNHGSFTINFAHTAAASDPGESYPFEFPDATTYPLLEEQAVFFYQNPGSEAWNAVAYTAPPALSSGSSDSVPSFLARNWWGGRAQGQDTSYKGVGSVDPTVDGTPSINNQAASTFNQYETAASTGSLGGVRLHASVGVQLRHGPTFIAVVRTSASLANVRVWIGLTDTVPTNADNFGSGRYVMFRYSTVAGDGGWVGVARNGSGQTVTATVAAIATDTDYLLKIRVASDGATAYFSVNGGAEVALAANLPTGTETMGFAIDMITTENVLKRLNISRHFCDFGT